MPKLSSMLAFLLCLAATPAAAQVTVDLHALDQQQDASPASPPPDKVPDHKPAPHHPAHRTTKAKPAEKPGTTPKDTAAKPAPVPPATTGSAAPAPPSPAAPAPPAPTVGLAPPPVAVIPPIAPPDTPMAPVPPPTISASAGTTIDTLPKTDGTGIRLDFANGQSDLTQSSADAVKALVAAAPKDDATTFNVMAYATGVPEDPSTARRLSLSRALSVRSALMAYGVPSTHIYVRALGATVGDGPQDRVDVLVLGANDSPPTPGAPPGKPPGDTGTRTP